jgi:hypothetical protein
MPAELKINWRACGQNVDGSTIPSETLVSVRSRHLLDPPLTYTIYRLIPKPFWKFWGRTHVEETVLDAIQVDGGPHDPGGLYESSHWRLPAPPGQIGYTHFQAWTDSREAHSGLVGSARMWIQEEDRASHLEGELTATLPAAAPTVAVAKPKIGASRTTELKWSVRAPVDPRVRIRVLQGSEVLEYLREAEADLQGAEFGQGEFIAVDDPVRSMHNLPPDTMTYFVDESLEDPTFATFVGPRSPVEVEVHLPDVTDLRAAIALEVLNIEDGRVTRTPAIFATHVGDRVVLTDLTFDMIRDEPRQILTQLAESNADVSTLAERRGEHPAHLWQALVEATKELGAGSVGEAAAFATYGTRTTVGAY